MREDTTPPPPPPPDPYDGYDNVQPLRPATMVNPEAERAVLGAILNAPALADRLRDHLEPDDFDDPRHEAIWDAIHAVRRNGLEPDPVLVFDQMRETDDLKRIGGGAYLHDLYKGVQDPDPAQADAYAALVRNASRLRSVDKMAIKIRQLAATATPDTVDVAIADAHDAFDHIAGRYGPRHHTAIRVPNIDEILAGPDVDTYDWVIPGLLEHQERVILTAEEGAGKSTLLRQIAVTTAAGIHPFTGQAMAPQRVLHIDVENSLRQSRRRYRPIRLAAGHDLDPENLRVEIRVEGIDLTQANDRDWLYRTTDSVQPDLILIGPIYKLANGDPNEETSAKPVAMAIDQVRANTDSAVMLEAHVAKANGGTRKRPHEPYGWSGWMRWPELGIFLAKSGGLHHWRGAREEREWPESLHRGGTWPWTADQSADDTHWAAVRQARLAAGEPVSMRNLEQLTGISKGGLQRLIGAGSRYADAWAAFNNSRHVEDS